VALSAPGVTGIVLDCEGMDFIDSQGSAKLREILELTERAGITLRLPGSSQGSASCCGATTSWIASVTTGSTEPSLRPCRHSWSRPPRRNPDLGRTSTLPNR
jgi:hypothetical protein